MSTARIARGRRTQRVAADWYRAHGFPHATPKGAFEGGRDIENMLGLTVEVKATSDGDMLAALRQAEAYAGSDLAYVLWRPNGYGEQTVASWPVILRNEAFTRLLRDAGYGNPVEVAS